MKAELLPLSGKYYGTKIGITHDYDEYYEIKFWLNDNFEPSDRELEDICTIEEWRKDKELYELCGSHYENRKTHKIAMELVDKINS